MKNSKLIILGGFAGAGKTTIAAKLSSTYNFPIFSSDVINDVLRSVLKEDFHEVSPMAYVVMWHLVRKQLEIGMTVIVDTHMATPRVWESLDAIKRNMPEIQVLPIILQATLEIHRARIEHRGLTNKEHLNLGGGELEDVLFKYEFIDKLHRPDLIRVDANGQVDEVYASVEKLLSQQLFLQTK